MKLIYRIIGGIGNACDAISRRGMATAPTYSDPMGDSLRTELEQGNWQSAAELLRRAERSFGRRYHLVGWASDWPQIPAWMDEWMASSPKSGEPYLVRGAMQLKLAQQARGSGYADSVSERGMTLYFEHLEQAQRDLLLAAERLPQDPTPWAFMLDVGIGLSFDAEEMKSCFSNVTQRAERHLAAHHRYLQYKCQKWHGSHDEMWTFARQASSAAPRGSTIYSLIAAACIEHAAQLSDDEGVAKAFWARRDVSESLAGAFSKMNPPGKLDPMDLLQAYSLFAFALWKAGSTDQAAVALNAVGPRLMIVPWAYDGLPARTLRNARRHCGLR